MTGRSAGGGGERPSLRSSSTAQNSVDAGGTPEAAKRRAANPFSTRFVRPSEAEFLFPGEAGLSELTAQLQANGFRGEIVGPHGTGKTTLLHALARELAANGRQIVWIELHDGQRRLPLAAGEMRNWNSATLVVVDGYEQLSWWSRRRLAAACKRSGCGLLISSHASVGLPPLFRTAPTIELVQALVERLLAGHRSLITTADTAAAFAAAEGDVRETLFRLYDVYEERS